MRAELTGLAVPDDVQRVVDAARTVAIPSNRDILHVIPQEFVVDDQTGIRDPVGMSGVRLEAEVLIITASSTAVRNVGKGPGRGFPKAYMHNGYFKTLKGVVNFYNTRDVKPACPDPLTLERDALVRTPAGLVERGCITARDAATREPVDLEVDRVGIVDLPGPGAEKREGEQCRRHGGDAGPPACGCPVGGMIESHHANAKTCRGDLSPRYSGTAGSRRLERLPGQGDAVAEMVRLLRSARLPHSASLNNRLSAVRSSGSCCSRTGRKVGSALSSSAAFCGAKGSTFCQGPGW